MSDKYIYLDHASATPLDKRALKAMEPYLTKKFYNPSSPYAPAVEVKRDYVAAKKMIAQLLGARIDELTMTAGATESINLAFANCLSADDHLVTLSIEHHAVIETAKLYPQTFVSVNGKGIVDPIDIKKAITDQTTLVSVALVNNELGVIQPIKKIAELIEIIRVDRLARGIKKPLYLHTDASQAATQLDLTVSRLGVDLMTLNAGKMYGPKQVGLLWAKSGIVIKPQIVGGGQEHGARSGTENVSGVIGFAAAFEVAEQKRKSEVHRLTVLRDYLENHLKQEFPQAIFSGDHKKRLASYLHVSFPELDGERLVFRLENRKVLVATGSACSANSNTRSHVLMKIGLTEKEVDGSLRITLGALSNEENIKQATKIIIEEVKKEYERVKNV